ncbi:MAG: ABC transporter permease [Nanoarchaeota archaeon]
MLKDSFFLAVRNVRKRGIRSWLTMLGIFIGIAAVVSLISLGQGLQTAITGQFATLSTDRLVVSNAETGFGPPGSTAIKKLTEHDLDIVSSTPGVKIAASRLIRIVKAEYNSLSGFEFVGSVPKDKEGAELLYDSFSIKVEEGRLLESTDRGKVVLGSDFIANNPYDKLLRVGSQLKIQGKNFEVIGILKRASTFQLNSVILMPEEDLKEILKIGDEIDLIAVQVENPDEIERVAENIERRLRKDRDEKEGEEDFSVQTPVQAIESVNTVLDIVNIVVTGIAAISLLIGGIGIANTMFTSVLERTREIGVMKSIGAQNKDILSIFIIESSLLGLVGGIVGAAIGLSLALVASSFANSFLGEPIFQVTPSIPLLLSAISFSLAIGILSGIIPAYQASRLNPVEALRK